MANNHEHNAHGSHGGHHLVPLKVYWVTIAALIVLTVVTVGVTLFNFGTVMNVIVALTIASIKASLVLMFFMGLKYDNMLNRAYILSSFAALLLLIGISAADLWTRKGPTPVKVSAAVTLSQEEFDKLIGSSTDAQMARGKEVYDVNCATCHGIDGKGDGIGGGALDPKPRNFHSGAGWTYGSSTKAMYVTLANGVAGTGMASYKALPASDRIALIHYVHHWMTDAEQTSKADGLFAQAVKDDGIGAGGTGPKATIPVGLAIERMAR